MIVGWLKNHIAKANFSGKDYRSVMDIKFANMHQQYEERGEKSVMKCERSVIIMTLHWHSSQISSFDNCVDDTPIKTIFRGNSEELSVHVHRTHSSPLLFRGHYTSLD